MKNAVRILGFAALASVLLLTTCFFEFDENPEADADEFVPVENIISGIPTSSYPLIGISLWGTVMPKNATNNKIEWSIKEDGGTFSTLEANRLTANDDGTVTVTAIIKDGLGKGVDYSQDFDILISLKAAIPVIEIRGIPSSITRGTYTLDGYVIPSNASNRTIVWAVKDAGATGAEIYGHDLTTTSAGTAVLTATIVNGIPEGDYTQDFSIIITKNVYTAGHYGSPYKACYWVDDTFYELDLSGIPDGTKSITTGIVFAGGKMYISGGYGEEIKTTYPYTQGNPPLPQEARYSIVYTYTTTACYWVDGTRHDLNGTQTLSIAADGNDVYITGFTRAGDANSYCYWKIDGNGAVTKKDLNSPGTKVPASDGTSTTRPSNTAFRGYVPAGVADVNVGRLAVSGGNVYIPFYYKSNILVYTGNMDYALTLNYVWDPVILKSYYWDETGTINDISFECAVNTAAVINGNVYMAGFMRESGTPSLYPCYFVKGDTIPIFTRGDIPWNQPDMYLYDYNVIYSSTRRNHGYDDGVRSIVTQNGQPWFYCATTGFQSDYPEFRYTVSGDNRKYMPPSDFEYDANKVIFSEGDVYIALKRGELGAGYVVLDGITTAEKQTRRLIDPLGIDSPIRSGQISGIAVP